MSVRFKFQNLLILNGHRPGSQIHLGRRRKVEEEEEEEKKRRSSSSRRRRRRRRRRRKKKNLGVAFLSRRV
jgi:hypothetical protein